MASNWKLFSLAAVKVYDYFVGLTPAGEAEALIHELGTFDIYSNSWGPSDNGMIFAPLDEVINAAFVKGVTEVNCFYACFG